MGAAVSSWQPPENDELHLSREEVRDILGEDHFDEDQFNSYSKGNDWVTVAEFKLALYEHAQSYIEGYREESADENKKSPPDDADGETLISASEGDNETSYQDTATVDSTLGSGGGVESAIGDGTKGGADTVGDTSAMEEDFSETVLPAVAIKRISAEELEAVIEEMEEDMKEEVTRFRELLQIHYEQTKEFFFKDPSEVAANLMADYYFTLDNEATSTRHIARYYETDSSAQFTGIPDIVGRRRIAKALVAKYSKLRVRHRVLRVDIDESPPNMCMYLLTCTSTITLDDDSPRKIMEIFYVKDRDDELKVARYGPYYIYRQILVVLDPRPLYTWPEAKMRETAHDNWDENIPRPEWLVQRQISLKQQESMETVDGEGKQNESEEVTKKRGGDGSDSDSDSDKSSRRNSEESEGDEDDEDGEEVGTQRSAITRKSSVLGASILPRRQVSVDSPPPDDDVSAMSWDQ